MNNTAFVHSGIKGMKHGQRRYQNPDGTYTELGKESRRVGNHRTNKQVLEDTLNKLGNKTKVRVSNSFDDWGNSKETNLLRVTGLSGSGKSIFTKMLAKETDAEIMLRFSRKTSAQKDWNDSIKRANKWLDELS